MNVKNRNGDFLGESVNGDKGNDMKRFDGNGKALWREMQEQEYLKPFGRMSISVQDERNSPRLFYIKEEILRQGGL